MILPVTLAVWIGLVGSVFTGARRLFRTITLSYCCRVTPVLTVHFVHRSCIILVVLDSVVILFTRRPCPADMEPTDDGAGHRPCAMTEMIFLFIASLAGMMIVPCNRALVLQCSSLPSMAYLRFPLACRILLTIVLAPLASAWTSSNLPMPIVPPATSLPLAPRPGTPCATHVCKLPSVTIQGGAVHVLKPNGTSTCSLGESLDLKHAADLKAPLDVSVWDDLPHSPTRPVVPLTPAMLAGPCLSDLDMCTTDSCSSLGPEQPNQASCAACACRAHTAAPCTIPRTPTATRPSALYENETYSQPSGDLCLPPSQIGEVPPSPSYMYELALGVPQYPPDERWDSQLTYPLEGNYARWPRASTPDPQQVPLRLTGWERELPGSHEVCPRLWLTIAAADAADAREASKPHRVSDAVRQPSGTYTAEPGDSLPMTSSVLFSGFPEVVELDRPLPSAHDWPVQSDGLSPLERQQVKDEAEYWLMHREAEAREMQDEAD